MYFSSGILRSSTILTTHRDSGRHSAPVGQNSCNVGGNYSHHHLNHHHNSSSYHQRHSVKIASNSHELAALSGPNGPLQLYPNSKELMLKSNLRPSGKWTTATTSIAGSETTPPTESSLVGSSPPNFNGLGDTNYLANRTALMS